jgi:hypothetical protein
MSIRKSLSPLLAILILNAVISVSQSNAAERSSAQKSNQETIEDDSDVMTYGRIVKELKAIKTKIISLFECETKEGFRLKAGSASTFKKESLRFFELLRTGSMTVGADTVLSQYAAWGYSTRVTAIGKGYGKRMLSREQILTLKVTTYHGHDRTPASASMESTVKATHQLGARVLESALRKNKVASQKGARTESENIFFSPLSASIALSMLYQGATDSSARSRICSNSWTAKIAALNLKPLPDYLPIKTVLVSKMFMQNK